MGSCEDVGEEARSLSAPVRTSRGEREGRGRSRAERVSVSVSVRGTFLLRQEPLLVAVDVRAMVPMVPMQQCGMRLCRGE